MGEGESFEAPWLFANIHKLFVVGQNDLGNLNRIGLERYRKCQSVEISIQFLFPPTHPPPLSCASLQLAIICYFVFFGGEFSLEAVFCYLKIFFHYSFYFFHFSLFLLLFSPFFLFLSLLFCFDTFLLFALLTFLFLSLFLFLFE